MPPAATQSLGPLGDLEIAVLEYMWAAIESDVAAVHTAVGQPRGITLNTIGSTLERLHKKGLLFRHKVSHAFRYAPALSRDEFAARRVFEASKGLGSLARAGLLSAFVDLVAEVDHASLDRLANLIAAKRSSAEGGKP